MSDSSWPHGEWTLGSCYWHTRPSCLPLPPEDVKFMLVALMRLSNHLILCCPLLLLSSHFSNIRVFSRESSHIMRWPRYWSLRFRICPSSEHSGLISFKMDMFVLLAVQGTLQHHNSKIALLMYKGVMDTVMYVLLFLIFSSGIDFSIQIRFRNIRTLESCLS